MNSSGFPPDCQWSDLGHHPPQLQTQFTESSGCSLSSLCLLLISSLPLCHGFRSGPQSAGILFGILIVFFQSSVFHSLFSRKWRLQTGQAQGQSSAPYHLTLPSRLTMQRDRLARDWLSDFFPVSLTLYLTSLNMASSSFIEGLLLAMPMLIRRKLWYMVSCKADPWNVLSFLQCRGIGKEASFICLAWPVVTSLAYYT